jgi:enoyl-CoA hydratase/carnithine racemase
MTDPTSSGTPGADAQTVCKNGRTSNWTESAHRAALNLPNSLVVSQRGAVTLVQLSRPDSRNALNIEMLAGIETVFRSPPVGTRAIVLHGGGNHFCAGGDLAYLGQSDGADIVSFSRLAHQAFDQIEYGSVPVVAVLHGAVIGGGLEIAMAAHIRIAEQSAFYALPEGMRGIFVGGGGAVRIPRLIGSSRMIDMMLTGRTYSAMEGASLGFSHYVVEGGQGISKGIEIAERIAANATLSNFAIVQALPRIARSDPDAGLLMESLMCAVAANNAEAKARIQDFLQKRAGKVSPGPEPNLLTRLHDIGEQRR